MSDSATYAKLDLKMTTGVDLITHVVPGTQVALLEQKIQKDVLSKKEKVGNLKSPYRGVSFHVSSQRWRARLKHNRESKHLGYFESDLKAAQEYNKVVRRMMKRHVRTNPHVDDVCLENEIAKEEYFAETDSCTTEYLNDAEIGFSCSNDLPAAPFLNHSFDSVPTMFFNETIQFSDHLPEDSSHSCGRDFRDSIFENLFLTCSESNDLVLSHGAIEKQTMFNI